MAKREYEFVCVARHKAHARSLTDVKKKVSFAIGRYVAKDGRVRLHVLEGPVGASEAAFSFPRTLLLEDR